MFGFGDLNISHVGYRQFLGGNAVGDIVAGMGHGQDCPIVVGSEEDGVSIIAPNHGVASIIIGGKLHVEHITI